MGGDQLDARCGGKARELSETSSAQCAEVKLVPATDVLQRVLHLLHDRTYGAIGVGERT